MFRNQIYISTVVLCLVLNVAVSLSRNIKRETTSLSGWSLTDSMNMARAHHVATSLSDGRVLVSGGSISDDITGILMDSEIYDVATRFWSKVSGYMNAPRMLHGSSLLLDGTVLVSGGLSYTSSYTPIVCKCADLFDPIQATWVGANDMHDDRQMHTSSLLSNGKVLVTGGTNSDSAQWNTCELYDPLSEEWSRTGKMHEARSSHTATVLPNGKVLVAGGIIDYYSLTTINGCEIYDPLTANWTKITSMNVARGGHTATLLKNGQVLMAGGSTSSCELYDPSTNTWTVVGSMHLNRSSCTATLLPNGKVLAAGSSDDGFERSTEIYDPATRNWTKADDLLFAVEDHIASILRNGDILIAGGYSDKGSGGITNLAMQYSSSLETITSSNVITKLALSRQTFMSTNEKVSATVEEKFNTDNNTQ